MPAARRLHVGGQFLHLVPSRRSYSLLFYVYLEINCHQYPSSGRSACAARLKKAKGLLALEASLLRSHRHKQEHDKLRVYVLHVFVPWQHQIVRSQRASLDGHGCSVFWGIVTGTFRSETACTGYKVQPQTQCMSNMQPCLAGPTWKVHCLFS